MEGVSVRVRNMARDALLGAGARGFVRFAPPGGALLITDAPRHCQEAQKRAAVCALQAAGFACREEDTLLLLTPEDALLQALCVDCGDVRVCWNGSLCPVQTLAVRLGREDRLPLTPAGRQLVLEVIRLLWREENRVMEGADAIRARAAQMLRTGDRSGFCEAGQLLAAWCHERHNTRETTIGGHEIK